uniref:NADH-ubiquinone oxidoreductase chain 4 n=1 Tax=Erianthus versicolor TaxID=470935 RepID=K9LKL1_9ORTH|nr:NADH dehydrogenase subunit 4 [Erianthus versicolor]
MLKFILFIVFLMPLCLMINSWWIIHSLMFIMIFMFILQNVGLEYFCFGYFFGMDLFSYLFILLSMWICVLMLTSSFSVLLGFYYFRFFLFVVLFLLLMLLLSFYSLSIFSFYLFFESSIIPTLLLIIGWGYQPERLQAGIYLFFYTLFASLPLLLLLMSVYYFVGYMYMPLFVDLYSPYFFVYLFMIMAFLLKIPLFVFHIWLPKAHVEAPVSGSMILDGVLLKLGIYGKGNDMSNLCLYRILLNYLMLQLKLIGGETGSLTWVRHSEISKTNKGISPKKLWSVMGGLVTSPMGSWVLWFLTEDQGLGPPENLFCQIWFSTERVHLFGEMLKVKGNNNLSLLKKNFKWEFQKNRSPLPLTLGGSKNNKKELFLDLNNKGLFNFFNHFKWLGPQFILILMSNSVLMIRVLIHFLKVVTWNTIYYKTMDSLGPFFFKMGFIFILI